MRLRTLKQEGKRNAGPAPEVLLSDEPVRAGFLQPEDVALLSLEEAIAEPS